MIRYFYIFTFFFFSLYQAPVYALLQEDFPYPPKNSNQIALFAHKIPVKFYPLFQGYEAFNMISQAAPSFETTNKERQFRPLKPLVQPLGRLLSFNKNKEKAPRPLKIKRKKNYNSVLKARPLSFKMDPNKFDDLRLKPEHRGSALHKCWRIYASGAPHDDCAALIRESYRYAQAHRYSDPIALGRNMVQRFGRVLALERLIESIPYWDDSRRSLGSSTLENRVHVHSSSHSIYKDSLFRLSSKEKAQTVLVFFPGYGREKNKFKKMMDHMKEYLRDDGFATHSISVVNKGGPRQNNPIILKDLKSLASRYKYILPICISKGANDFLKAVLAPGTERYLTHAERSKIKIVLSFAGVNRFANSAWFAMRSFAFKGILASTLHFATMPLNEKNLGGMASVATDPFESLNAGPGALKRILPEATWVSTINLPRGSYGRVYGHKGFETLDKLFKHDRYLVGPVDGLMESASALIPRDQGVEQWIVRLLGTHNTLDGVFLNGEPITPSFDPESESIEQAGIEMIDHFFATIPYRLLY